MKSFCHFQAARALRMNPAGPELLQELTKAYAETGEVPEAPRDGLLETLKEVFRGTAKSSSNELPLVSDLAQAVGEDPKFTLRLFAEENYLLSLDKKGVPKVALRSDARSEDAFRACLHTELLRQAMDSGLPEALTQLGRKSVAQDLIRLTKRALPDKVACLQELTRHGWHLSLSNLRLPTVSGAWSPKPGEMGAEPPIPLETLRGLFVKLPERDVLARLIEPETSTFE